MILFGFTEWQRKVIEAVIEHGSYGEAALHLSVKVTAVKAVFYKVRTTDRKAWDYHKQVIKYQRGLGPKKRYLT